MTARADIRDLVVVREELADLVAYLNGLPDEVRRAGAFTSYEQRVGELSRELVLTDMLLTLKLPGDNLLVSEKPVDYGRIYDSLSAMTRSYEQAAARSTKVSRGIQWALLVASAASVASALTPAMLLVLTFSTVAASLAGVWVGWLAERTRKQEKAAMHLSALREVITQSFGLTGQVLRPSEYYSASTRRIESLLDEIRRTVEPSRPASSVR